jgi:hypothetical protein
MLRPSDSPPKREVCEEFVPHEFLTLNRHAMCGTCTHLQACHAEVLILEP